MPLRQSIAIHMSHPGKEGQALGTTRSMRNLGQLFGFYSIPVIYLLFPTMSNNGNDFPYFRTAFLLAGVILVIGFLVSTRIPDQKTHLKRDRLYFRKKYWRYYVLEMFFGARKQVFFTFAPFVLILNYQASTEFIALLYGIYSLINI